ncbi:MAG: GAP family protein [Actinomycetota bacterium]
MSLFIEELPLALGAAVSPTILTVGVLILAGKKQPMARAAAYAIGAAIPLFAIGIPGVLLLHEAASSKTGIDVSPWVDVAVGVLLIGLGLRRLSKRKTRQEKEGKRTGRFENASPIAYLGIGVVMMLTNFTTLALYLPMLKDIARSGAPAADRIVVLLLLDLIVLTTAVVPPLLVAVVGAPARRALEDLNSWIGRHGRTIATAVFLGLGVYLVVKGLGGR